MHCILGGLAVHGSPLYYLFKVYRELISIDLCQFGPGSLRLTLI